MKSVVTPAFFIIGAAFLAVALRGVGINSAPGVAATGLAFIIIGCTLLIANRDCDSRIRELEAALMEQVDMTIKMRDRNCQACEAKQAARDKFDSLSA